MDRVVSIREALQQGGLSQADAERLVTQLALAIGRWADARVRLADTKVLDPEAEQRFRESDAALRDLNMLLGRDMQV